MKFVGFFSHDLFGLAFQYDLAEGIIVVIAGIFALTKPERSPEALAVVVGMIALVDGIFKVQTSLDAMKFGMRYWWVILLVAALTASFGMMLLFGHAERETAIEETGLALIVTGLQNLWMVLYTVRLFRGDKKIEIRGTDPVEGGKRRQMRNFGEKVVKYRKLILIIALVLMIPSAIGMRETRVNYDMLVYLPDDMDTVKGQDILMDEFGKGAISTIIVEGMTDREVADLKADIAKVDHVDSVVWYDSVMDLSVPKEMLPDKLYDSFNSGDATMLAVFFDTTTSADETMDAVKRIRRLANEECFVTGLSALVTDLKDLCEQEEPIYVGLAVACAVGAMMVFMDSWFIPFIFLASIGMAILLNMGTNYFLGEISYITKAMAAVLQLAVTMDYSIFLWHSYEEQTMKTDDHKEAMAVAINKTLTSVIGSSVTTIAGFIALCFMSYTLGADIGIVMAKGVLLGVIGCVTTLPALILLFDKFIHKTIHKTLLPKMDKISRVITKRWPVFIAIFALVLIPSVFGYIKTNDESTTT